MAIFLRGATDPDALLNRIVKAVKIDPKIETWALDQDGMLIHTPSNWAEQGRFEASVDRDGDVAFHMKSIKGNAYHYLHGRLVELLMGHFLDEFKNILILDRRD